MLHFFYHGKAGGKKTGRGEKKINKCKHKIVIIELVTRQSISLGRGKILVYRYNFQKDSCGILFSVKYTPRLLVFHLKLSMAGLDL